MFNRKLIDLYAGNPQKLITRLFFARPIFVKDWVQYEDPVIYARQYRVAVPALPVSLSNTFNKYSEGGHLFSDIGAARQFLGERIFTRSGRPGFSAESDPDCLLRDFVRTWAGYNRSSSFLNYYLNHLEIHLQKYGVPFDMTCQLVHGHMHTLTTNAFLHGHIVSDLDFYRGHSHEWITIRTGLVRLPGKRLKFWFESREFGEYLDLKKLYQELLNYESKIGLSDSRFTVDRFRQSSQGFHFHKGLKIILRTSYSSKGKLKFINKKKMQPLSMSAPVGIVQRHIGTVSQEPTNVFYLERIIDLP